jgi:hypothetical protein
MIATHPVDLMRIAHRLNQETFIVTDTSNGHANMKDQIVEGARLTDDKTQMILLINGKDDIFASNWEWHMGNLGGVVASRRIWRDEIARIVMHPYRSPVSEV